MREIQYLSGFNKKCRIRNLSKNTYIDLKTGTIKTRKHNKNRSQSPKSFRKSINRLTDLIRSNIIVPANCKWLTLTYSTPMTDGKKIYYDGKMVLHCILEIIFQTLNILKKMLLIIQILMPL